MSTSEPFDYRLSLEDIAPRLRAMGGLICLDSAWAGGSAGRYSYAMARPSLTLTEWDGETLLRDGNSPASGDVAVAADALQLCEWVLSGSAEGTPVDATMGDGGRDDLPAFRGGWAGYVGYDWGSRQHGVSPPPSQARNGVPLLQMAWYDWVMAWDHFQRKAWLIVRDARPHFASLVAMARGAASQSENRSGDVRWVPVAREQVLRGARGALARCARGDDEAPRPQRASPPASQRPDCESVPGWPAVVRSNFSRASYMRAVQDVRELILAGDIFQANISQRFTAPVRQDSWSLYLRLREENPAPYAAYLELPEGAILSASPEMFLCLSKDGDVETRPVKGTRPRGQDDIEDDRLGGELLNSEKDRAENLMIVDLLRNDLSRVCEPGSVFVPSLCELERWTTVQHLVSSVRGSLRKDTHAVALFRASFPGGSITGAPKTRAMQIIESVERSHRGVYCGSLGYFAADGAALFNIAIRTITLSGGLATFSAGGGVVLDSEPEMEYEETLAKAEGLMRTVCFSGASVDGGQHHAAGAPQSAIAVAQP